MSSAGSQGPTAFDGIVLDAGIAGGLWPVSTRWRAAVVVKGEWRSPEWLIQHVRAVPLSSRAERELLRAVAADDGRQVLEMASSPGEHQVAAAVIAALRLAGEYPDRALRFLEWVQTSPTDPRNLRFLRRYLPGLQVLVMVADRYPVAMPLSAAALAHLRAELLRTRGALAEAEAVLEPHPASASRAVAISSLRLAAGDPVGAAAFCEGRPISDPLSAALALDHARIQLDRDDPAAAATIIGEVLTLPDLPSPVELAALSLREQALRELGRDVEADMTRAEVHARQNDGAPAAEGSPSVTPSEPPVDRSPSEPEAPLFGRSVADALDDAWARVRRQDSPPGSSGTPTDAEIASVTDEVVELARTQQFDIAETILLGFLDRLDAAADRGETFDETCFVLLAGVYDRQQMPAEEVATLERLRAACVRAGKELSEDVVERLLERRGMLDALAARESTQDHV